MWAGREPASVIGVEGARRREMLGQLPDRDRQRRHSPRPTSIASGVAPPAYWCREALVVSFGYGSAKPAKGAGRGVVKQRLRDLSYREALMPDPPAAPPGVYSDTRQ